MPTMCRLSALHYDSSTSQKPKEPTGIRHTYLGEEASWVDKDLRALESLPVVWGRGGDLGALEALEVPLGYSVPGLTPLNVH